MAAHFLGKLENPYWIAPLAEHGLFKHPPNIVREGKSISFPVWPASQYLVRAAQAGAGAEALSAILEAEATDNHLVHLHYVEVALASPLNAVLPFVKAEHEWIGKQPWLFALLPEKYGELVARLATVGVVKDAFALARTLLAVFPDDTQSQSSEAKARFDAWHYREVLKRLTSALAGADQLRAITLFCDLLFDVAKIRNGPGMDTAERSIAWRPAIEHSDQNWDYGEISDLVVDTARDVIETALRSEKVIGTAVREALEKRSAQGIFRRLLIHIARVFKDRLPALASPRGSDACVVHAYS